MQQFFRISNLPSNNPQLSEPKTSQNSELKIAGIGFAIPLPSLIFFTSQDSSRQEEAKALGFESYSEQQIAEKAGFLNAIDWQKFQDEQAAMNEAEEANLAKEEEVQQQTEAEHARIEKEAEEAEQARLAELREAEWEAKRTQEREEFMADLKQATEFARRVQVSTYTKDFDSIASGITLIKRWAVSRTLRQSQRSTF